MFRDCAIIARPPDCFRQGHPDVVRLFPNYLEMEESYYERTKVWPIMHIIAIQTRVLDEHPWVARNLYNAVLRGGVSVDQVLAARFLFVALGRFKT